MGDSPRSRNTPGSAPSRQMSTPNSSDAQQQHPGSGLSTQPRVHAQSPNQYQKHQPPQQLQNQQYGVGVGSQQAFQPQGSGTGQHGMYDMAPIAHNLPKVDYSQPQYGQQGQGFHAPVPPSMHSPHHLPPNPAPPYGPQMHAQSPVNQVYYANQTSHASPSHYYGVPIHPVQPPAPGIPFPYPVVYYLPPSQVQTPAPLYYGQTLPHSPGSHATQSLAGTGQYSPLQNRPPYRRQPSQPTSIPGSQSSSSDKLSRGPNQQQRQDQGKSAAGNIVRAPPRKPKQSGLAIWIGNLPPQTPLMDLVQHVCQHATGLESLFLISRSNCAFANFKDEKSCLEAQKTLHDSMFASVRLVSRLRRSAGEGAQGAARPAGSTATQAEDSGHDKQPQRPEQDRTHELGDSAAMAPASTVDRTRQPAHADGDDSEEMGKTRSVSTDIIVDGSGTFSPPKVNVNDIEAPTVPNRSAEAAQTDRFFILKSLTEEDLEQSTRTGIWATQAHNELAVNSAFKSCTNVYLIFSANKSGAYFGYARMTSPMNEDPAAAIEFAPKVYSASDVELPKAIPSEATEFVPRGHIIDDSARGTIFWEADRDEGPDERSGADDGEAAAASTGKALDDASSVKSGDGAGSDSEQKTWGKPFQLEWLSTARLPFYRTRGMRNSLNANREIKIARDGTELDPVVGRRLIGMFHQQAPNAGPGSGRTAGTGQWPHEKTS